MSVPPPARSRPKIGCIADDVTGATDLAINLVQGGLSVIQVMGVPTARQLADLDAEGVVVALKTRSIAPDDAVEQSLAALTALRAIGVERFFFKYCSTFDSTEKGNIGPVAVALMDALEASQTIVCPAFPRNGRTVYRGHLFVNGRLLNESGMERHPLNPMTDPDLVRFLGKQAARQTGLLPYEAFATGVDGLRQSLSDLAGAGAQLVVTDACDDNHLAMLARATADMPLLTGGSGIARFLPEAYREAGVIEASADRAAIPLVPGRSLILSGSCSKMTIRQVAWMERRRPAWKIDVSAAMRDSGAALDEILAWAKRQEPSEPLLVYSTAPPDEVAALQAEFGGDAVAKALEGLQAAVAKRMVEEHSVRRLVLAGGETSGAVTNALGVRALRIGAEIAPGVPWTVSIGEPAIALALKSGNFGEEDFFETALKMLP